MYEGQRDGVTDGQRLAAVSQTDWEEWWRFSKWTVHNFCREGSPDQSNQKQSLKKSTNEVETQGVVVVFVEQPAYTAIQTVEEQPTLRLMLWYISWWFLCFPGS